MNGVKICVVFGTRPEVIKLAPIIMELERISEVELCCINTGQHRELSDPVIDLFQIKIHHSLNLMKPGQSLHALTSRVVDEMGKCLKNERPDLVIVQGDTTTAFATGLVAYYQNIKLAHVEAGMRTLDKSQPFPEEFNRHAIDYLAQWNFSPCEEEAENLLFEFCKPESIHVVGNTIVDAIHYILQNSNVPEDLSPGTQKLLEKIENKQTILVTTHRRENFGQPFINICKAVKHLAKSSRDLRVIFVRHPNQNWQGFSLEELTEEKNIFVHSPFNYLDFVHVMKASTLILTDSGGIQEEAAVLGVPVLILRNKTERVQGVKAGIAKIVGTNPEMIVAHAQKLLNDHETYRKMITAKAKHFYGQGDAAKKIVEILLSDQKYVQITA